jgi:hypothetical protein
MYYETILLHPGCIFDNVKGRHSETVTKRGNIFLLVFSDVKLSPMF